MPAALLLRLKKHICSSRISSYVHFQTASTRNLYINFQHQLETQFLIVEIYPPHHTFTMIPRNTNALALTRRLGPQPIIPFRNGPAVPIRIGRHIEMVDRQTLHHYLPNLSTTYRGLNGIIDLNHLIQTPTSAPPVSSPE
jgi:hypothetical protein